MNKTSSKKDRLEGIEKVDKTLIRQSRQEIRTFWFFAQRLPVGVREKVLYQLPLSYLATLCRVTRFDFCWKLKFWEDKLKHDGYILPANYRIWLKKQIKPDHVSEEMTVKASLPQFYSYFELDKGMLACNLESERMFYRVLRRLYNQWKDLNVELPLYLPGLNWETHRDNLEITTRAIWYEWQSIEDIRRDLFYQTTVIKKRNKGQFLCFELFIKSKTIPADFETLLAIIDAETGSFIAQSSLPSEMELEISKGPSQVIANTIRNRICRLQDLLTTGDLIRIRSTGVILFTIRSGRQIKFVPCPLIGNTSDHIFLPPEAFTFVTEHKLHYRRTLVKLYSKCYFGGYTKTLDYEVKRKPNPQGLIDYAANLFRGVDVEVYRFSGTDSEPHKQVDMIYPEFQRVEVLKSLNFRPPEIEQQLTTFSESVWSSLPYKEDPESDLSD